MDALYDELVAFVDPSKMVARLLSLGRMKEH